MEEIKKTLDKCPKLCKCIKSGDDTVITIIRSVLAEHPVPKAKAMLLLMEASI